MELIVHENEGISASAVHLLSDMTDPATITEAPQSANVLLEALLEGKLAQVLVANLPRLDSAQEDQGVQDSLNVVENLTNIFDDFTEGLCANTEVLAYLVGQLQPKKKMDANMLYCSEILAILLQYNPQYVEFIEVSCFCL